MTTLLTSCSPLAVDAAVLVGADDQAPSRQPLPDLSHDRDSMCDAAPDRESRTGSLSCFNVGAAPVVNAVTIVVPDPALEY
jgi:hypothetical protein